MVKISAILLGAGESKRMGVNKLNLRWGTKTIFERCLDALLRSNVTETIVVLNRKPGRFPTSWQGRGVKVVVNPLFRRGMSTSIRRGIKAVDRRSDGILIALGDHPFLQTRTINALIRVFARGRRTIIVPSFRKKKGHPVIFHRKYKKELLTLRGDVGARSIVEHHIDDVGVVPVKSEGVVKDIDTPEDYYERIPFESLERMDEPRGVPIAGLKMKE